jgi:iron complex outermembrane receptor protein
MPSGRQNHFRYAHFTVKDNLSHLRPARVSYCGLFLLLFLALPPAALSQTGGIAGTVRDQKQGVVPGAKVSLRNAGNQVVASQATKNDGAYLFSSLAPGTYDVEVTAAGFGLSVTRAVKVAIGETANLDITLGLETVASSIIVEGTAVEGYAVKTAPEVGPWGDMSILDAPYSISVAPKELLENTQVTLSDQYWQNNPFTQLYNTTDWGSPNRVATRGFFDNNQFIDGLKTLDIVNNIEDKQSVEVITGLSGFFYGPVSIGGILDSTLERPTPTQQADVTIGGNFGGSGGNGYVHVDAGGPIGSRFGYRVNLVGQGGDGSVDSTTLTRGVLSGALDIHLAHNLLLQIDSQKTWYGTDGTAAFPIFFSGINPPAPDAATQYGQDWAFYHVSDFRGAAKLTWSVNEAVQFKIAYSGSTENVNQLWTDDFAATDGTVSQAVAGIPQQNYVNQSGYAELDTHFTTGPLSHHVILRSYFDTFLSYGPPNDFVFQSLLGGATCSQSFSVPCPQIAPVPVAALPGPAFKGIEDEDYDDIIGDEIVLSPQWSVLAGVNWTNVLNVEWNPPRVESSSYHRGNFSPSASILFKPIPTVSTYFSYMQGLEPGENSGQSFQGLPVTNPNVVSPPVLDHQYEVGAKAQIRGALLTLSLFDIDRGTDVFVPNGTTSFTFLPHGGLEQHAGVEVGVSGKVTRDFTLWGGGTWFNAKITQEPDDPALIGKEPPGIAQAMVKVYGEYAIRPVRGLSLTGAVYWTGSQWVDAMNTQKLPGWVTGDLGARYDTSIRGRETIFRFDVKNISGANYWLQTGELDLPRTIGLTIERRFGRS